MPPVTAASTPPAAGATEDRSPATYAAFAAMCLIWGSTFLAIRIGNEALAPVWSAVLRLAVAAPLYALIATLVKAPWPRGAALRAAVAYGLLNYGVNFALLYWGEVVVPSSTTAIVYATIPLTTAAAVAIIGLQPIRKHEIAGALIGLVGVVLVFSGELSNGGPLLALAAIFIAATCGGLASVALKRAPKQSTWVANAVGAASGLLVCVPVSLALGERWTMPHGIAGWGPLLYLIVAGNLGAYALLGWLVTRWKVTNVNAITLVVPVIAVLLGALVRNETPSFGTILGAGLVLAGVALTLFAGRR